MTVDAMRSAPDEKPSYVEGAPLSVLGYREEGEWVALALEMDLRGYGPTFEVALEELRDLVLMQISFAHSRDQPEMIWKNAEDEYWEEFRRARESQLLTIPSASPAPAAAEVHAGGLTLPPTHLIAAREGRFAPADG